MQVVYRDLDNRKIDPSQIRQGMDFKIIATVTHRGVKPHLTDLALTQIMPSGWEILPSRLGISTTENKNFTYRDIRDDRVMTYFSLNQNAQKSFEILVNAAYAGKYFMPGTLCEDMYDHTVQARKNGMWVEVARGE